jgi:hypothetical protein
MAARHALADAAADPRDPYAPVDHSPAAPGPRVSSHGRSFHDPHDDREYPRTPPEIARHVQAVEAGPGPAVGVPIPESAGTLGMQASQAASGYAPGEEPAPAHLGRPKLDTKIAMAVAAAGTNPFAEQRAALPSQAPAPRHVLGKADGRFQYPTSLITAGVEGVWLDSRAKMALQLLLTEGYAPDFDVETGARETAAVTAARAMDVADALYRGAAERGWVADLPLNDDLLQTDHAHIRRNARAQVSSQIHGQALMQAEAQRVQPVIAGGAPPRMS